MRLRKRRMRPGTRTSKRSIQRRWKGQLLMPYRRCRRDFPNIGSRMNAEELEPILIALKRQGVHRFRGLGLDVEFLLPEPAISQSFHDFPKQTLRESLNESGSGVCACGHEWVSHSDDGCLLGCGLDSCAQNEAMPQE